jgi:hypothetical protein
MPRQKLVPAQAEAFVSRMLEVPSRQDVQRISCLGLRQTKVITSFRCLPNGRLADIVSTSHPSHRSFLTEVTCIKDGYFFCAEPDAAAEVET